MHQTTTGVKLWLPTPVWPCYLARKSKINAKNWSKRAQTASKLTKSCVFINWAWFWHSKPYFRPFRGPKFEKSRTLLVRARYLVYSPLWEILSILGYVLTSSLKFRVFFKKLMGSFFQFWAKLGFFLETFAFFPGKNLKFFGFFFLENVHFSRQNFSFLRKKLAFFAKIQPFCAWKVSVFSIFLVLFFVQAKLSKVPREYNPTRCPMFHASIIEQARRWRVTAAASDNTLTLSLIAPSIFKASCDGRWVVTHSLAGSDFHGHRLLSVATNTFHGIWWAHTLAL